MVSIDVTIEYDTYLVSLVKFAINYNIWHNNKHLNLTSDIKAKVVCVISKSNIPHKTWGWEGDRWI